MRTHDVLIAGGGPVGLLLALLLGETGLAVQLIEPAAEPPMIDGAAVLLPSILDALDRLGLAQSLVAEGIVCNQAVEFLEASGETAEFDFGLLRDVTSHPYILHCEMRSVSETILNRLAGCPNVRLQFGARVSGFSQTGDSVDVEVEGNGERFVDRASFLCGCDGASSVVRAALGFPLEGTEVETIAIDSSSVESAPMPASRTNFWQSGGQERAVARLPMAWRVTLAAAELETGSVLRDRPAVAAGLTRGRVALAGDAAHTFRPEGEAGLTAGLNDAFALAGAVDNVLSRRGDLSSIDQYGKVRRADALTILAREQAMIRRRRDNRDLDAQRACFAGVQAIASDREVCRKHLERFMVLNRHD